MPDILRNLLVAVLLLSSKTMGEWVKKMWHIYTMEYYPAIKKNEILPLATTWTDLEGIILSEISQTDKDKYHMISLLCGI